MGYPQTTTEAELVEAFCGPDRDELQLLEQADLWGGRWPSIADIAAGLRDAITSCDIATGYDNDGQPVYNADAIAGRCVV